MCWYCHLIGDVQKCGMLRRHLSEAVEWLQLVQDTMHNVEIKRRAYWVAWVIDQWIISCTLSDRMINEWQCPWPQSEETFHEMIHLSMILKDIHEGIQSLQIIETNLITWLLNLPSCLNHTKTESVMTNVYRILYYTAQMILNQRHQHQLSNSICITAANTIFYITEQMTNCGQASFTYNIFFLSLSFATSFIHLNPEACLSKHISLLKQVNCSLLSSNEFDQLLQDYLIDKNKQPNQNSPFALNDEQLCSDRLLACFLDNESYTTTTNSAVTSPVSYFSPTQSPSVKEEMIFDPTIIFY